MKSSSLFCFRPRPLHLSSAARFFGAQQQSPRGRGNVDVGVFGVVGLHKPRDWGGGVRHARPLATTSQLGGHFSSSSAAVAADEGSSSLVTNTALHEPTHAVENQVRPLVGYNLYSSDAALRDAVDLYGGGWAADHLNAHGTKMGSEHMFQAGDLANRNKPELKTHDANGNRVDVVEYHPAYHDLMASGIGAGATAFAWNNPGRQGAHVARAGLMFMQNQTEAGHCCPLVMTFAAVPALRSGLSDSPLRQMWLKALCATEYDPANVPIDRKVGATVGMSMTEKQGGSDVQTNSTTAVRLSCGEYALRGHKWFTSAPMSDAFLTLARISDGSDGDSGASRLSCFLVPRWLPNGERNEGLQFQRLKDKLGDRSNASSEVEYRGARGFLVGEPGKGINSIVEMVHHTRLDCALGSAGGMRRAVAVAAHHAASRQAFGASLAKQPLMGNVLADLMLESEAATHLVMRTAKSFDDVANQVYSADAAASSLDDPRGFSRLLTAVAKYFVCKQFPLVAYEAMECLGGNGYVEDFPAARIYRQAPLNAIWEGSGNVLALDVLRTLSRVPSAAHSLFQDIDRSRGLDAPLDAHIAETRRVLRWAAEEATPSEQQGSARALVGHLARAVQGAALVQNASQAPERGAAKVAALFCASRLGGNSPARCHFGTLPSQVGSQADFADILTRHSP
jgi:putative acyl-CoA dehydrogenase